MKQKGLSRWLWPAAFGLAIVLLFTLLPAQVAWAHGPSDGGADRGDINGLFTIIFWMSVPVFLLVEGLILFAIIRYRRRHKDEQPEQIAGSRRLELTWTVLSFAIIAVIFAITYRFMTTEYEAKADNEEGTPDYTVHVEGYMFNWDYTYFRGEETETGVKTTRKLTLPANKLILLEITSRDVQHSFWVPDLAGKVDAVPGHENSMWLHIDEPGLYKGNCAEYCGTHHYDMVIEVDALEPAAFETWLSDQETQASAFQPMGTDMESELPAGDEDRGETLFESPELGCTNCHGAQPGAGPSLAQIRGDMGKHEGYTADEYLRESILMPCEHELDGFSCAIMPSDYGEKLDAQMLADLIEYLKSDTD